MLLIVIILTKRKNTGVLAGTSVCSVENKKKKGRENKASQRKRRLGAWMQSIALGHLYLFYSVDSWPYCFAERGYLTE